MKRGHLEHFVAITPLSILKASFERPSMIQDLIDKGYSKVSESEYPYL
jgi:hypothetical protein